MAKKRRQSRKNSTRGSKKIDSTTERDGRQPSKALRNTRLSPRRPSSAPAGGPEAEGALGSEGELEVADDLVDRLRVFDEGDDAHLATAGRTEERSQRQSNQSLGNFIYNLGEEA